MSGGLSNLFWVTCKCKHTWIAAHLPMEMSKVAAVMKGLHCPKCGNPSKMIFTATKAEVEAAEGNHG